MRVTEETTEPPLLYEMKVPSREEVAALKRATRSTHISGTPPTLTTICREGEWRFLKKLGIKLQQVLHAEQQYTYFAPIKGNMLNVATSMGPRRFRAGLTFLGLKSEIKCDGTLCVVSVASFVVKGKV